MDDLREVTEAGNDNSPAFNLPAETVLICARDEWERMGGRPVTWEVFASAVLNVLSDPRIIPEASNAPT
jgi:hypothetical protein